jgi:hypothetical protein
MSHSQAKAARRDFPAFLSLANHDRIPFLPDGAPMLPGQVYALANDSRFTETNFSEPLTTFAVGWKDPNNLEGTLEFFSPKTPVPGRLFEWKKATNAEEFFTETDDIRAIGADFKRVEYTAADVTDKTLNKGLTMRVDLDNVNTTITGWENRYVAKILRRLLRNELLRGITLLSAAATVTPKVWNAAADPDADVVNEEIAAANQVGFQFNRAGYGHTAWATRFTSLRGNANPARWGSATMTPEQLAMMFGVDEVFVSKERYQSSAAAKSEAVGNMVLMFFAQAGLDVEDPSNIKRFVSPPPNVLSGGNEFKRPSGGLDVNVYVQQTSAKLVDISVEHYAKTVMTSTLGVREFTVTAS